MTTTRHLQAPVSKRRDGRTKEQRKVAAALAKAKKEALSKDVHTAWGTIQGIVNELALKHNMKEKKVKKLILHLPGRIQSRTISDYNVFSHVTKLKINKGIKFNFSEKKTDSPLNSLPTETSSNKPLVEMQKICKEGYEAFKLLPDEEKEPFRQLLREKREADLRGARKLAKSVGQDVKHVSDKIHSMVLNLFA